MAMGSMTRRSFLAATGASALALTACGGGSNGGSNSSSNGGSSDAGKADGTVVVEMVTDTGGVNDQSFNQLAWAGMQRLQEEKGYQVSYIESKQESDFATNLDKAIDDNSSVVWGIGYAMGEAINNAAEMNPDVKFAAIECSNEKDLENLVGVAFKSCQPSFLVGYIAARMSESGKVGFVGGMTSPTIQEFEYGYYAGVEYANKENSTSVKYQGQYAESFGDAAKGSAIAKSMITDGCDVLFHAAGGTGVGMLEECNNSGVWAIGVDQDQAVLFPEYTTIITSALKKVDEAVVTVTNGILDGSIKPGNIVLGAAEDAVGLAETHTQIPDDVYKAAMDLLEKIKSGAIEVPQTKDEFDAYVKTL